MDRTTPNSFLICQNRRCVAERLLYFKALMVPTCLITVAQTSNVVFTMPQVEYEGSGQKLLKPLPPIPRPWRFVPSAVLASLCPGKATPGRTGTARIPPRLLATVPTIIGSRGLQDCCCCAAVYSETVIRPGACANPPQEPPDRMTTPVPAALVSAGHARNKVAFCIVCHVRSPLRSCVMNLAPTGLQPGQTVIPFLT